MRRRRRRIVRAVHTNTFTHTRVTRRHTVFFPADYISSIVFRGGLQTQNVVVYSCFLIYSIDFFLLKNNNDLYHVILRDYRFKYLLVNIYFIFWIQMIGLVLKQCVCVFSSAVINYKIFNHLSTLIMFSYSALNLVRIFGITIMKINKLFCIIKINKIFMFNK